MTDNPKQTYRTFEEFWPFYLSQHTKPETRYAHMVATLLSVLFLLIGIVSFKIGWFLLALLVGYGVAWAAHAFIENNQPATFTYPLMSLRADFHMLWLFLNGVLGKELEKHNIR